MKNHLLRSVSTFILTLSLGLSSLFLITAYAEGGGSSTPKENTVNGYTYSYDAYVYAGYISGKAYANASVSIRTKPSGTNAPAAWMYAQGKLYTHSGVLKATASANTNSSSSYWLNGNTASLKPADASTLYYGSGTVGFWNGRDYTYYTANKTPSFSP